MLAKQLVHSISREKHAGVRKPSVEIGFQVCQQTSQFLNQKKRGKYPPEKAHHVRPFCLSIKCTNRSARFLRRGTGSRGLYEICPNAIRFRAGTLLAVKYLGVALYRLHQSTSIHTISKYHLTSTRIAPNKGCEQPLADGRCCCHARWLVMIAHDSTVKHSFETSERRRDQSGSLQ